MKRTKFSSGDKVTDITTMLRGVVDNTNNSFVCVAFDDKPTLSRYESDGCALNTDRKVSYHGHSVFVEGEEIPEGTTTVWANVYLAKGGVVIRDVCFDESSALNEVTKDGGYRYLETISFEVII